ncbi:glycerol-3-phosphate transporter ATP-binding subunit [compost metagenome]
MNILTGKYAETEGAATIGIRPEHITITTGENGWNGEIVHSEMLGSDSYIYVEIGAGEPIVVREEGVTDRKAGERIAIVPDAAQIHRFDAQGRALARNPARGAA